MCVMFLQVFSDARDNLRGVLRTTKLHNVVILPLCNPGSRCDPDLPQKLSHSFFHHERGVASFIRDVSVNQDQIRGVTTTWLRPDRKIRNARDLIASVEKIVAASKTIIDPEAFDIYLIYAQIGGPMSIASWPEGQVLELGSRNIMPGLVFVLNGEIYTKPDRRFVESAIVPSMKWGEAMLNVLELEKPAHLYCDNMKNLYSCDVNERLTAIAKRADDLPSWKEKSLIRWRREEDLLTATRDGVYHIYENQLPRALEIKLEQAIKLGGLTLNHVVIEPKSELDSYLASFQPRRITSLKPKTDPDWHIYLGNGSAHAAHSVFFRLKNRRDKFNNTIDSPDLSSEISISGAKISLRLVDKKPGSLSIAVDGMKP